MMSPECLVGPCRVSDLLKDALSPTLNMTNHTGGVSTPHLEWRLTLFHPNTSPFGGMLEKVRDQSSSHPSLTFAGSMPLLYLHVLRL